MSNFVLDVALNISIFCHYCLLLIGTSNNANPYEWNLMANINVEKYVNPILGVKSISRGIKDTDKV